MALSRLLPLASLLSSGAVMMRTWLNLKPKPRNTDWEVKPLLWLLLISQTVLSVEVLANIPSLGESKSPSGRARSSAVAGLPIAKVRP